MVAAKIRPMVRPVPMAIQSWIRQAMPQSCKIEEDLWSQENTSLQRPCRNLRKDKEQR